MRSSCSQQIFSPHPRSWRLRQDYAEIDYSIGTISLALDRCALHMAPFKSAAINGKYELYKTTSQFDRLRSTQQFQIQTDSDTT